MKKIFFILLLLIALLGCNSNNNDIKENDIQSKIWLFHLGQPKSEVINLLNEDHYEYITFQDSIITTTNPTVNFIDIDWDDVSVTLDKDSIVSISFMRYDNTLGKSEPLSNLQIGKLKDTLTSQYGEMRENRKISIENQKIYVWFENDMKIQLLDYFDGSVLLLTFSKEGHEPFDLEEINKEQKELSDSLNKEFRDILR